MRAEKQTRENAEKEREEEKEWESTRKARMETANNKDTEDRRQRENQKATKLAEKEATIMRDTEEHRSKSVRRSNTASLSAHFTREMNEIAVADEQTGERARDTHTQAQNREVGGIYTISTELYNRGRLILPKTVAECLAKWVICQDVQENQENHKVGVVWDRQGLMSKYQDIWKRRVVRDGQQQQDVPQETKKDIEVISLVDTDEAAVVEHAAKSLRQHRQSSYNMSKM